MQVVFALVHEQLKSEGRKMEQVTVETSAARKEPISGWFGDEDTADEQERSPATEGFMSSVFKSV